MAKGRENRLIGVFAAMTIASAQATDVSGSLQWQGMTRTYVVHVPASYDGSKPVALVVNLHGGGGSASGEPQISAMNPTADRYGFIVVYPQGIDRLWADGRGTGNDARGIDDVGFIRALVKKLESQYRIDARRVNATGISNGGFMTERLACQASDIFAAVAPVAAELSAGLVPLCKPSRPVPIVTFHGTRDPLVPYSGGSVRGPFGSSRGSVLSAADSLKQWARMDGCKGNPRTTTVRQAGSDGDLGVSLTTYANCSGNAAVELYTIAGGGHTWPEGQQYWPAWLIGPVARDLDANAIMWRFFNAHPMR